ncbi:MAG: prepilin-type N-terminal cleavage/methylation domain-containing protein [Phycisphaerae bacterium]|nr:prepilin-type N-terminal cleavage/methylation domain-containing protein [Phycisphaerae bacterium]
MCRRAFTLIELLVVVAIIAMLIAILIPSLKFARAQAYEVSCRSNMHQIHLAIEIYANERNGWYPLVDTEVNPHDELIEALDAYKGGLVNAMYCPQAHAVEPYAQNTTDYPPKNKSTSIIDTDENREVGNISYFYWSMEERSNWRSTNHTQYPDPNMDTFRPRWLRNTGDPKPLEQDTDTLTPTELQDDRPGDYWVLSDFFRKQAPFPHTRKHKSGLNILFLDGHGEWVIGQPRAMFK